MMKKQLLTLLLAFIGFAAYGQVTLAGKVTDEKGEPMVGALVVMYKNGVSKNGSQTDFDGVYRITNVDPGKYDVECKMIGYTDQKITGVQLTSGVIDLNFKMVENGKVLDAVVIKEYKVPIVKVDQTQQGQAFTADQIAKLPLKDVNAIVATAAGVSTNANGTEVNIKGSRSNGTDYIIDGIRVRGTATVPVNEIEQLQVVTGGMEAKYGDVVGGVITITTKGPAKKLTGGIELETSEYLDAFKYNFANANLSGPIISRTRTEKSGTSYKETVLGFRLSGQMRTNADPTPPAIPVYRVKPDVLRQLEKNPWAVVGAGTRVASAELLKTEDFEALKVRPNQGFGQYEFTGKLEGRINKNMDATLFANYYRIDDKINPSDGSGRDWQVFNYENNPTRLSNRYRLNFRFRHRLGSANTEGGAKSGNTTIENAQYTLQFGYESGLTVEQDPRHKQNFFNYGYVGKFNTRWIPFFRSDSTGIRHDGYSQQFAGYELSDINPVLANYNRDANGRPLELDNGGLNMNMLNSVYNRDNLRYQWNFHQNVGAVYNRYQKEQQDMVTGQAMLNFDLYPGGSKERAHNIQVGFLYEQRVERTYEINPFTLWNLAEQLQNGNINGTAIDTTKYTGKDSLVSGSRVRIFQPLENKDILNQTDLRFYRNLREKTGQPYLSFGNVNNLTPDQMSLDMFTARELNDQDLLRYFGYDYLGNRIAANQYSFNDFFTAKDANGVRIFPVAPLQPLYIAGYIQDKFRYKDVIFSLGVRVDRFDNNNKVLKDPYSLYDIMNAKDFYELLSKSGNNVTKPENIGDDYKVYITENTYGKTNPRYTQQSIRAYRAGDQWYSSVGQPVDPVALFGEGVQPFAKYATDVFPNITQLGYDPNISFRDYQPQTNVMPRLAFSFPIGEKANFFAHYDILVQRPRSNLDMTALDYFYFDERTANNARKNNPDIRPEKTIDYEVGFQQELTPTSGIKIGAYYKEMRDMIQQLYYRYLPAPLRINEYVTFGNADFGTVKGFTFQYDLRRTGNFSGQFNYTLQFADGTGSDASSQQGLNRRGNIRTLSPVTFDERHRFAFTADYRFDEGQYNGPTLFGAEILKNTGINLQLVTVSGRPYTKRKIPQPFGSAQIDGLINGARLPWTYNLDMRVDRNIALSKDKKRPLNLNVYLRVQNLLDTRNVAGVYTASGAPDDDGYLASPRGQSELANTRASRENEYLNYVFSYQMRMLDPSRFYQPRRIYLGCMFDF
jgi:outer membrane receptor protein involved in Fe transport